MKSINYIFFEEIKMEYITSGNGYSLAQDVPEHPPRKQSVLQHNYRDQSIPKESRGSDHQR